MRLLKNTIMLSLLYKENTSQIIL